MLASGWAGRFCFPLALSARVVGFVCLIVVIAFYTIEFDWIGWMGKDRHRPSSRGEVRLDYSSSNYLKKLQEVEEVRFLFWWWAQGTG